MLILNNRRKRLIPFLLALFLLLVFQEIPAKAAFQIPKQTDAFYVNDVANLMEQETEDYIVGINEKLYDATGAQIVVVTLPTLDGNSIEEYSTALFRQYGIGSKDKNNGVLFLLALQERECRIEVGYGLEGAINDALAGRILDRYVIPAFQEEKWDEGLKNGFNAILEEVMIEYDVEIEHVESVRKDKAKSAWADFQYSILIFMVLIAVLGGFIGYLFQMWGLLILIPVFIGDIFRVLFMYERGDSILMAIVGDLIFLVIGYLYGFGSTLDDGGYSGSGSDYTSRSRSSSGSSSRNYGGGGSSGGGGASRKF